MQDWVSPTSCVLAKKECFDRVGGFDESLPARQDYDMWLRIARHFHFDFIKEPLANIHFLKDQGRISLSGAENQITAEQEILRKFDKDIFRQPIFFQHKIYGAHYFVLGKRCWKNRNSRLARHFFSQAIQSYPFSFDYWLAFAGSFLGEDFYNILSKLSKSARTIIKE